MRIVIVSDTHTEHEQLGRLRGDVLIHCGDSANGFKRSPDDVRLLDDWFGQQDFDRILCTGGNHDFAMEDRSRAGTSVLRNAEFLQDRSVHYRGVHFYGAPWTPELAGWAFYLPSHEMREKWALIPESVDVLITHAALWHPGSQSRRPLLWLPRPGRAIAGPAPADSLFRPRPCECRHVGNGRDDLRERIDGKQPVPDRAPSSRVRFIVSSIEGSMRRSSNSWTAPAT